MTNRLGRHCLAAAVTSAFLATASPPAPAAAASVGFSFASGGTAGTLGTIGVDAIYGGAGGGGDYDARYVWRQDGSLNVELANYRPGAPATALQVPGSPTAVRMELYPKPEKNCSGDGTQPCYLLPYDPWKGDVGGLHIERSPRDGPDWLSVQGVHLPVQGRGGAFRIEGSIASSTAVPDGRVHIDLFQYCAGGVDPCPNVPRTANGALQGAFASSQSRGTRWTGSIGWPGRYIVFIRDTTTGRRTQGFVDIAPGRVPTIDLDAVCFGLDTCNYLSGAPAPAMGGFHPVNPTRILDTRLRVGIPNGPVRTGDGRVRPDLANSLFSLDERLNHEVQVTGAAGIPASGVSAVLLNVTAVEPPADGFLSVVPRPPALTGEFWNDQSSYLFHPSTSNLNVRRGETIPNLVLARVGAGGKIRIYNSTWPMHVVADVAGWFDTAGANAGGLGFTGVVPTRVADTRSGAGGIGGRFAADDDRSLRVAGLAGVPSDARSVVLNITAASPGGTGYVTAYPDGARRPNASNLNLVFAQDRPNLAVVRVGAGGRIRLAAAETSTHLIVDVLGYYGSDGGQTVAVDPVRIFDTRGGVGTAARALGPGETRQVQVAGRGGVPSNATGVIVNVTVAGTTASSYLSVWPAGTARPTSSNLNWTAGRTIPNLVMTRLGSGGALSIANASGQAHVIVDVMGYVR
ncbi:MAG: hypothetical protein WAS51_03910 [Ilumatobacteraceae bacterium]